MSCCAHKHHGGLPIDQPTTDIESFGVTLERSAAAAFPGVEHLRYQEVHVLLLSWQDDDTGVIDEVLDLERIFYHLYHFEVEHWRIPSKTTFDALRGHLGTFIERYDGKDSLSIIYYGGYGFVDNERQCMWSCKVEESDKLPSGGAQTSMGQADSDVLVLLNCCATESCIGPLSNAVTEVIAADEIDTLTPGVREHVFARSLIDALVEWSGYSSQLSAAMLHSEILSRIRSSKIRRNEHERDQPQPAAERKNVPLYAIRTREDKPRSILLTAMAPPTELASPITPVQLPSHDFAFESKKAAADPAPIGWLDEKSLAKVREKGNDSSSRVLLSLAIKGNARTVPRHWASWAQSTPASLQHAYMEGVYESDSLTTLILLTLPVAIWNLLPKDPSVKFITHVQSHDLTNENQVTRSYNLRHAKTRLVDFLNDDDEPGVENLRQQSNKGTSLMTDKSDWVSDGSLPAFSADAASEDTGSIATDMGEKDLKNSSRLLALGASGISFTPELPQADRPVLECPFRFLGCELKFIREDDWLSHSLTHFQTRISGRIVAIEPPTVLECSFCDAQYHNADGAISWSRWMEHMSAHHRRGERLAHARPNFALIEYAWQQGLLQQQQYLELKGPS